jgi:outer membrane protein
MRKIVLLLAFVAATFAVKAQNTKVGFADVDYIFTQLPDAKRIDTELKDMQAKLKAQIDGKSQEFSKKLKDYNENASTMIDAVRVNTERELQQLQQNLQALQQDAETSLQKKQRDLMEPVYKNVGKAIEDVAKENGFSFILNQQIGGLDVILYGDEKMDVSDLVLKKLGVTPKPNTTTTTTTPGNNAPKQ